MAVINNLIINLNEKDHNPDKIGGKAFNLAKMSSAGFKVPPAFIISVDAYDFLVNKVLRSKISTIFDRIDFNQEESIIEGCSKIRNTIKSGELPPELLLPLKNKIKELPPGYYAVRSSATEEDLSDASFAGQLDSFLNIGKNDIIQKVKECWASYWNDRAVKYRHDYSMNTTTEAGIAVIVQKMVEADVSGVTFTINPVDGSDNVLVESTWGLGEAIASGIVSPDIFILDRLGNIIETDIKTKKKAYYLINGENTLTHINKGDRDKASLNQELLKRLLEIAVELEEFFGVPQDIEWAIECGYNNETGKAEIYVLQSRPVTTIKDKDDILWTRAYGDEYWADATTPLFFDVMGKMLTDYVNHEGARIMGYKEITDSKLLKLHKSRVYFNTWVLEKVFSYYPKFARSKELLNYFPREEQERISQYPALLHKTLLSQLLIAIRDPDGMMHKTDKAYRKWARGFMEKCRSFDHEDLKSLSDQELLTLYDEIEAAGIKHYQLIRYGMVNHSIATNLMIKNWLVDWLDDQDGTLYAGLISGLDDNKTVEMNIRFSDLAKILRKDSKLLERINNLSYMDDAVINELISSNKNFKREFDNFIRDYGHRSHTREILYPRWREDRAYVLNVVKSLSSSNLDLREKELESRENRLKTEKIVNDKLKKQRGGFFKSRIFKLVLHLAQTYLTFRENQRFYLDHLLFRQRLMLLEIGRRLNQRKIIDKVEDVFFFYEKELFQTFKSTESVGNITKNLSNKIHKRKMEFDRYKSLLPPKFIKNGIEFDDTITEYDKNVFYGAAASPGIYSGQARVVLSIEELSSLENNEILITSNTDPAWTAIFSRIGGLITETGGILSHGAVISREYRIPAVTAVKDATRIFKTGEELLVDGNRGVVYKQ